MYLWQEREDKEEGWRISKRSSKHLPSMVDLHTKYYLKGHWYLPHVTLTCHLLSYLHLSFVFHPTHHSPVSLTCPAQGGNLGGEVWGGVQGAGGAGGAAPGARLYHPPQVD